MRLSSLYSTLQLLLVVSGTSLASACSRGYSAVKITLATDKYPEDNSWKLRNRLGNVLWQSPHSGYQPNQTYKGQMCVKNGKYSFAIQDKVGDGLCCKHGDGYYRIEVQNPDGTWWKAVQGGERMSSKEDRYDVHVGPRQRLRIESRMTERDRQYLEAHNVRRKRYHEGWGKEYVPMKWSEELKKRSKEWADEEVQRCKNGKRSSHDADAEFAENVTSNQGNSASSWGQLKTPDENIRKFVERESNWEWARNGHLVNAVWRPAQYVGCAESEISWRNSRGKDMTCHRVVCRYAKPGNCSMGNFKDPSTGKVDWEAAAMQEDSLCGPHCPPEGCYT